MAIKNGDYKIRCSFCGKTEDQVRKLIAGPDGSYICDECVEICSEIIEEEVARDRMSGSDINLMTPMEMKEVLDEYVVGQDEAKRYWQSLYTTITRESSQAEKMMWNCRKVIF